MNSEMDYEEEVQRNRRKKISKAKAPKKSGHKHAYEPCVVEYPANWFMKPHERGSKTRPDIMDYCPTCGKLSATHQTERWWVGGRDFRGTWSDPSEEALKELDPETRTLPTFMIEDPFARSVNTEGANE